MSNYQKVIKNLAIAFAIFLIVTIISSILYCVTFFIEIFDEDNEITEELNDLEINDNLLILDLDLSNTNVTIKEGKTLTAKTNSKYINSHQDNNKLYIKEKNHNWFINNSNSELIVYVPKNTTLDKVEIKTKAGKVKIEALTSKEIDFNFGAGKIDINNLTVTEKSYIEGGTGKIDIDSSNINNLDLELGVGSLTLTSKLTGKNSIEAGIGEVNINILGKKEDYQINVDKGIGKIEIDNEKAKDNKTYGRGENKLDIEGGIGSIEINFKD